MRPRLHPWRGAALAAAALVVLCGSASGQGSADPSPGAAAPTNKPATRPILKDEDTTELVVQLRDGRRFTGPVVRENDNEIVLRIAGIEQAFPRAEIEKVEILPPLMEQYRSFREAVGDNPDQIERLAEWLQQHHKYELALLEVNRALTIDKAHGPSLQLKPILEQQIVLKQRRLETENAAPAPARPELHAAPAAKGADIPVLSKEDIGLMKVYETQFEDHPRIVISRSTLQAMLTKYAGSPQVPITKEGREALMRQSPEETLKLMFALQAREFYGDVQILDQPKAFVTFRDVICRKWLVNSCSTNACHGGMEAGRLVLRNREPNSERTVYTNFLILTHYKTAYGTPLIDWENPDRSILLQMALPRDKSRRPHPATSKGIAGKDAFKPAFRNADDVQFKEAVDWIKSLYRPRPEYPFQYTPVRPFEERAAVPAGPVTPQGAAPPEKQDPAPPTPPPPTTDIPAQPGNEQKPEPKPR